MNINFNNLRRQACESLDRLIIKLNSAIDSDGYVVIDVDDIGRIIDDLRSEIRAIAIVCQKDNPEFAELDIDIVEFNPDPEPDHNDVQFQPKLTGL